MSIIFVSRNQFYGSSGASTDGHSHSNSDVLNNLSVDQNGLLTFYGVPVSEKAIETTYNVSLTHQVISSKSFPLPEDCDTSQAITLSLNGLALPQGTYWRIIEHDAPEPDLISWDGLELQHLAQLGDIILVSYYILS